MTKNTPVAGLLQFTDKKALNALEKFCREEKNIRSVENLNDLKLVTSQIPPFWDILIGICGIENETFLPKDIAKIVLRMIQIRHDTYHNVTPPRYRDDYFPYDNHRGTWAFSRPSEDEDDKIGRATKEIWVLILEKAWAKVFGSYQRIEAGTAGEAFYPLTGSPHKFFIHSEVRNLDRLYQTILRSDMKKFPMCTAVASQASEYLTR